MEFFLSHHIAFSLLAGFLLDCVLGDPHCFPHPVRFMGTAIFFLEKKLNKSSDSARIQRFKGFFLVFLLVFSSFLFPLIILLLCKLVHPVLFLAIESIMCYQCLAAKSLYKESIKVHKELKKSDLIKARKAVSMIVGRDTDILDEKGVTKAAVETIAENTADGVVAPIFFMALFGAVGGMVYKAVNTMDSMIAYKNNRYRNFGFCAAKLDDFANFIPARISAFLMIFSSLVLAIFPSSHRFKPKNALKIFLRDRYKHASPNSAQCESVAAGALGLQLAGDTIYDGKIEKKEFIGDKFREIEPKDILRTNILMYTTTLFSIAISVIIRFYIVL